MRKIGMHISGGSSIGSSMVSASSFWTSCQVFLGPPQTATLAVVSDTQKQYIEQMQLNGMMSYVHAPYVLHAFADPKRVQKNNHALRLHVTQANLLGMSGYVVHMGGTKHYESPSALFDAFLTMLKIVVSTEQCPVLLENCASGPEASGNLSIICEMIDEVRSAYDIPVGLCLDTCHAYAWGYDLNDSGVVEQVARTVSSYVRLLHLNSAPEKVKCGGHLDRHASINHGVISKDSFSKLLNLLPDIPVIFERDSPIEALEEAKFVRACDAPREADTVMEVQNG